MLLFYTIAGGVVAKYEKWLKKENLFLISNWAMDGLSDKQIADKIGISVSTLYEWKKRFSDFSEALKKSKEIADHQVKNAVFKKSIGYKTTVKKAFKLKEVKYSKDGKRISEKETVVYADDEIYIPPDTTAAIFWLKHRQPDDWGDKPAVTDKTEDREINIIISPTSTNKEGQNNG